MPKIRVLVVDDSVVMRRLLSEVLQGDPAIEVVGIAQNGRIALQKLQQVNPDVVTMDVEMPELDGLQALRELRRTYPRMPVIMFSSLTQRGASATLDALAAGATDYVTKPMDVMNLSESISRLREELLPRIRVHFQRIQPQPVGPAPASSQAQFAPRKIAPMSRPGVAVAGGSELLCIGSSTGGPQALETLFKGFTQPMPVPVALVQHMPPMFTAMMAERLNNDSAIPVRCVEASHGMVLQPGNMYIAPGGFHMTVVRAADGRMRLKTDLNPPVNSCRPSVDVMFDSVSATATGGVLSVILTGMGSDGANGTRRLREKGAWSIAQDEATSVVWGMPGAVASQGQADEILPLDRIAPRMTEIVARAGGRP